MDEEEMLRFLDDENEENDESTASCSTYISKIDKNILISVSVQGISSFFTKMEKLYKAEKDEGKLVRHLLASTKNSGGQTKLLHNFINCLSAFFKEITSVGETEKDQQKREIKLEKKFTELRCSGIHYVNVSKVWHQVCSAHAAYDTSVRNSILQLMLQHFWASGFKLNRINNNMSTTSHTYVTNPDETETETILDHAGWAIKRARDVIKKGAENLQLTQSNDPDSPLINANKTTALTIIKELGDDVAQHDGTHRFKVHDKASSFFTYLHIRVEDHLHENMVYERGDVLRECLEALSLDKDLRTKWMNLVGPNCDLEASIIVLQRIVTFFVKSKQQIFREKEGLKPNKNSVSLRREIMKPKERKIKKKSVVDSEISKMRAAGETSESFAGFLHHLCTLQLPAQNILLNQLTGKELAKLLKSLGKPSFQGKKKEKQVLSVIETLKNKDV